MLNRNGIKKILKIIIIVIITIIIVGYGLFAMHDFILGPYISISKPINGSSINTPKTEIEGVAKRIKEITINGRPITIDEKGNWKEIDILEPGYNVFQIIAKDKFGRQKEYRLELIYKVN